jgi:hypothetical protein
MIQEKFSMNSEIILSGEKNAGRNSVLNHPKSGFFAVFQLR